MASPLQRQFDDSRRFLRAQRAARNLAVSGDVVVLVRLEDLPVRPTDAEFLQIAFIGIARKTIAIEIGLPFFAAMDDPCWNGAGFRIFEVPFFVQNLDPDM